MGQIKEQAAEPALYWPPAVMLAENTHSAARFFPKAQAKLTHGGGKAIS